MNFEERSCTLEHSVSGVEFKIYYDFDGEEAEITGIYLIGFPQQDLIDIIDSEVKEDLENDILYEVEGL